MEDIIKGKNIFVTGATGFVGSYLLPKICASNKVRALVRRPAPDIEKLGAETVLGDIRDSVAVEKCARGMDLVIHLASVTRSNDEKLNYDVNVTGTKNIADACRKNNIKLIHVSTVNAVSEIKNAYGRTKELAEKEVIESGIDYVILRCALIYGKGSPDMEKIIKSLSLPVVPMVGSGKNKLQPVYVTDVIDAILKSAKMLENLSDFRHAENHRFSCKNRKIYNIAGPEVLTTEQFKNIILKKLGKKKPTVHIPLAFVLAGASVLEKISKNPFLTKEQALGFKQDRVLDISLSRKELGFNPISFEKGIEKYLNGE
ncbi:NAD-dependent epimerase/dehydratase family protein [archaeon]|nr:MAG: NAD-dependent epimerase/dehydratase family protein [archaeon]